jgi:hypothetical protein
LPWIQRAEEPPLVPDRSAGRPALDPELIRRRLAAARRELGAFATNEALAEALGVDVRTLNRWLRLVG